MLTTIPFPGFYESNYSREIDYQESNEIEYMTGEEEDGKGYGLDQQDVLEVFMRHTDYRAAYLTVAKAYVAQLNDYLLEKHGLALGLSMESVQSPKEYNFTTDRVFCHISEEALQRLFDAVQLGKLTATIKRQFTSRDGFISGYTNRVEKWLEKPLIEWDHNEIGTLIEALICDDEDFDYKMFEAMIYDGTDSFREAWSNAVDWPKVEAGILELRLIEDGEIEPDARQFPTGITDPALYSAEFDKLNNLLGG
jgi:hypothetical protein